MTTLQPVNNEIPNVVQETTNIINLDLCDWRYSYDSVKAFNKYYENKGSTRRMAEYLTYWQTSKSVFN